MKKKILIIVSILVLVILTIIYKSISAYTISDKNYKIENLKSALEELNNSKTKNQLFDGKKEITIDEDEISFLNLLLVSSLKTYNSKKPRSERIDLTEYRIYYVPMLNDKNEKLIFVSGYCADKNEEWFDLADLFMIRDGGNCYFKSVINLTQKIEGWIIPNGET